ncbi:hypothetical protein [Methylobacterium terricola]|uniref:hypothetical protein n=1 Tax=Methylobacterium terricola TaxID=2583531 RepID=UPI001FE480EE|nr:hypothetical protein [Methylobacterium terricola]
MAVPRGAIAADPLAENDAASRAGPFARHGIRLPLALSEAPDEAGVVRDADGREVFTVNTEGTWPDPTAHAVAALLLGRANVAAPRAPAEATEFLASALDGVRTLLAPIAEECDAALAALQIADDALADLRDRAGAVP